MTEELKNARDRVLVDNTAQAVFKHLDRIEDNRATLRARWIWELLQNARDAASGRAVRIWIRVTETELRFEHNGKSFKSDEIAHLVYHGSTKIESFEDIGQFGSGFLTSHLLSRNVSVAGRLEDSRQFMFSLDRTGATVEQLRHAMDRSWTAFEQSVENARSTTDATTSFAYEITEPRGRELAEAGLEDLRRCGPLALAFCPEICHIAVETTDGTWSLSRDSHSESGVQSFQYLEDGQALSRFVALAEGTGDSCAALQLRTSESGLQVDPAQVTAAKLFVLFPLFGSERLGLGPGCDVSPSNRSFRPAPWCLLIASTQNVAGQTPMRRGAPPLRADTVSVSPMACVAPEQRSSDWLSWRDGLLCLSVDRQFRWSGRLHQSRAGARRARLRFRLRASARRAAQP